MLFLKVFNVGDNFDSWLSLFHIVAPLYEKHFWPFADFRMGISKSDLVLRNSLLLESESLESMSAIFVKRLPTNYLPCHACPHILELIN